MAPSVTSQQCSGPGPDERLPGDRIEGVVGDAPASGASPATAVVAIRDVVGGIGEDHAGPPAGREPARRPRAGWRRRRGGDAHPGPRVRRAGSGEPGSLLRGLRRDRRSRSVHASRGRRGSGAGREPHLPRTREAQVDLGARSQVGQQTSQKLLVPGSGDPIEGEPEEAGLLDRQVEPDDWDGGQAEPPGGHEALVAADDGRILPPCQNRLDEAELAQASGEGVELGLADAPRIGRIGAKKIDRDLFDREGGERRSASGGSQAELTGVLLQVGCAWNARRRARTRRFGEGAEVIGIRTWEVTSGTTGAARGEGVY